jgi:hypothetical protein
MDNQSSAPMVFPNPFRPGAGHHPPYLAGRNHEQDELRTLLNQKVITQNLLLTGLRGVGKTVLLEAFQPIGLAANWLWVGTDLSESASVSEERLATRILADISRVTAPLISREVVQMEFGFSNQERVLHQPLTYEVLVARFNQVPGLIADKLKAVLEYVWAALPQTSIAGVVFAYDEAQNLSDHAERNEYPLSLLLEVFQSIQRKQIPFMLVLTGLPTLGTKLVESRTYSERMFHVVFLKQLDDDASRAAIVTPTTHKDCLLKFSEPAVTRIIQLSGGYPYFIQFICKEVYDIWLAKITKGEVPSVPDEEIVRKLDTDFFYARWSRATDRQRELLQVISTLDSCDNEFTVQEVVLAAKEGLAKGFSPSHVNQMLASLQNAGLIYKNRWGKYSLAVPMLAGFIRRQVMEVLNLRSR